MDLNPLTGDVRRAERDIEDRIAWLAKARSDLRWVARFDATAEGSACDTLRAHISERQKASAHKTQELNRLKSLTPSLRSAASKEWWNPGDWFADRSQEERILQSHLKKIADIEAHIDRIQREIISTRTLLKKSESNLARSASIDVASLRADIALKEQALPVMALNLENLRSRKAQLDDLLSRRIGDLDQRRAELRKAEDELNQARDLERQMSDAPNSYERKMLHDECSRRFGKSSPRAVVQDRVRLAQRAAKDLANTERAIRQELQAEQARGRVRSSERSAHDKLVRQWIALAQIEAWLYENAHSDVSRLMEVQAEAEGLRNRLTASRHQRRSQSRH